MQRLRKLHTHKRTSKNKSIQTHSNKKNARDVDVLQIEQWTSPNRMHWVAIQQRTRIKPHQMPRGHPSLPHHHPSPPSLQLTATHLQREPKHLPHHLPPPRVEGSQLIRSSQQLSVLLHRVLRQCWVEVLQQRGELGQSSLLLGCIQCGITVFDLTGGGICVWIGKYMYIRGPVSQHTHTPYMYVYLYCTHVYYIHVVYILHWKVISRIYYFGEVQYVLHSCTHTSTCTICYARCI